jgi:hypothetical protein
MKKTVKINSGTDPDTGEACRVLYIDGVVVPWWLSKNNVDNMVKVIHENPGLKDSILEKTMNHFIKFLSDMLQRPISMSQFIQAVEEGCIDA